MRANHLNVPRHSKARFLFLLLAGVINSALHAQDVAIPPSPTAAGLGEAVAMPVGLYTGTPIVNIPIFTIETGGFKLPISVSYTPGGVKLSSIASWCGLNWNLNAGGAISRSVLGMPDETPIIGYSAAHIPDAASDCERNFSWDDPDVVCDLFSKLAKGEVDGRPDLYYFSFPGASGRLALRADGKPMPVPMQPAIFNMNGDDGTTDHFGDYFGQSDTAGRAGTTWDVRDGMGNQYHFGDREKSATRMQTTNTNHSIDYEGRNSNVELIPFRTSYSDTVIQAVGAWYLSNITVHNNDSIRFTYATDTLVYDLPSSYSYTMKVTQDDGPDVGNNSVSNMQQFVITKRLSSITFSDGRVRFVPTVKDRADLIGDKALDRIVIEDAKGRVIRQFVFQYDYLVGDYTGAALTASELLPFDSVTIAPGEGNTFTDGHSPASAYRRLILRSIVEQDSNGVALNKGTSFEYIHDKGLPKRDELAADHWGYANHNTSTNQLAVLENGLVDFYPGSMDPDFDYTKQASLERINYPTGGYVKYTYEPNAAPLNTYPSWAPTIYAAGGMRLQQVSSYNPGVADSIVSKSYLYEDPAAPGAPYYRNSFQVGIDLDSVQQWNQLYTTLSSNSIYPMTATQGASVGYGKVQEFLNNAFNGLDNGDGTGKGMTEYFFTTAASFPDSVFRTVPYYSEDSAILPNPPVDERDWQRGLLTEKKVYEVNADGSDYRLKQTVENQYTPVWEEPLARGIQSNFTRMNIDSATSNNSYALTSYRSFTGRMEMRSMTEKDYEQGTLVKTVNRLIYYNQRNYEPAHVSQYISPFFQRREEYTTYAADFDTFTHHTDIFPNAFTMVRPLLPVEKITMNVNSAGIKAIIAGSLSSYNSFGDLIAVSSLPLDTAGLSTSDFKVANLPSGSEMDWIDDTIAHFVPSSRYTQEVLLTRDSSLNGFIKERTSVSGVKEVYIWGYNKEHDHYPVAKIVGSDYATASSYIRQSMLDSAIYYTDAQIRTELNKLRTHLTGAFVTTYTYAPLIGKTSETDPDGKTTYYEYDSFGRLKLIKDFEGSILKTFQYNYRH